MSELWFREDWRENKQFSVQSWSNEYLVLQELQSRIRPLTRIHPPVSSWSDYFRRKRVRTLEIEETTLSTRSKARQLMKTAEKRGHDTVDFSAVEFVSRAFADEALKQTDLRGIEITGLSGDVETMFERVEGENAGS